MRLPFDLIVVDLETAGDPDHRIVEIGAVRMDPDLHIQDRWSSLVDGRPLDPKATEVNNITEEMLSDAPKFAVVHSQFDEWCAKSNLYVLAAFGAYFDLPVLRAEYQRVGIPYPHPGHGVDIKSIVWWELLKRGMPCKRLTVDRAMELLGMKYEGRRHRGGDDAWNEARLLQLVSRKEA